MLIHGSTCVSYGCVARSDPRRLEAIVEAGNAETRCSLAKNHRCFDKSVEFIPSFERFLFGIWWENDGKWGFKRVTKPPIWDMFNATFSEVISTFHPFQSFGRHRCQFRCLCDATRQRDSLTCDAPPGTSFNSALQPSRDVAWCVKSSPRRPYFP